MSGGGVPPCLFSQKAKMATKEENLDRLRQLADLLEHEANMSESTVDITQHVSEQEEGLAVFPEGIIHSDESRANQSHADDGGQLNNMDAPDDTKAVRVRKCLQVVGYCPETGHPVELALRGMRALMPSSLATTMIQHETAEYA